MLFVIGFTPEPSTKTYALSVEWAVAGIDPKLYKIAAGQLPPRRLPRREQQARQELLDLPPKDPPRNTSLNSTALSGGETVAPTFSGLTVLRELTSGGGAGPTAHGGFLADYKRK